IALGLDLIQVGISHYPTAPTFDQHAHAFEDADVVVYAEHIEAFQVHRGRHPLAWSLLLVLAVFGDRHDHRKAGALARPGNQAQLQAQDTGNAIHNGQAEPQSLRLACALLKAGKLPEYSVELLGGYADACVDDLHFGELAAAAHAHQNAALPRIFDRVGNEVVYQAPQQVAVRMDH